MFDIKSISKRLKFNSLSEAQSNNKPSEPSYDPLKRALTMSVLFWIVLHCRETVLFCFLAKLSSIRSHCFD